VAGFIGFHSGNNYEIEIHFHNARRLGRAAVIRITRCCAPEGLIGARFS
jgi:hypothetical protein